MVGRSMEGQARWHWLEITIELVGYDMFAEQPLFDEPKLLAVLLLAERYVHFDYCSNASNASCGSVIQMHTNRFPVLQNILVEVY